MRVGPTPGRSSRIDRVIALSRRPRWNSMAKRWASSRTRCSSCSSGVSCASCSGAGRAGLEHLLDALGQADHGHAQVPERPQLAQAGRQLAPAAVDHDQRGQRGEALVELLVVRRRARAERRTGPFAWRAPRPWRQSHLERSLGCRSAGSPTSWARRPRTPPSTPPCGRPSGWRCRSTRCASGSPPCRARAGARRAPRCAVSGGARSAAGPGRGRAGRCARPARGCGACRRARRAAPPPARRGARRGPRPACSVPATARGTITCGGTAMRARVVLEHELLGHLALVALGGVLEIEALAVLAARRRAPGRPGRWRRSPRPPPRSRRAFPPPRWRCAGARAGERTALSRLRTWPPARTPARPPPSSCPGRAPARSGGSAPRGSR